MLGFAENNLTLLFENELAILTFNRPEKRNAFCSAIWAALPEALQIISARIETKVLIVRGAGEHFAAGADISEFCHVFENRMTAKHYAKQMSIALDALADLTKPSIAMIKGNCIGAGLATALACDLRIANNGALLGVTPAKLGLMYSLNDTKRLIDAVGYSRAKDLLFTGRLLKSAEALSFGLVDAVIDDARHEQVVLEKAQLIAAASQWSIRKTKKVIGLIHGGVTADTDETRQWFIDAIEGADYREGLDAFLNKRQPNFPLR